MPFFSESNFFLAVSKSTTQVSLGSDKPVLDLAWNETDAAGELFWPCTYEVGMQFPWHRDAQFWPGRLLLYFYHREALNYFLWVCLNI